MGFKFLRRGMLTVEVRTINPERTINLLWANKIQVSKVKKVDIATITIEVAYEDYKELLNIVKQFDGKVKIVRSSGFVFLVGRLNKKISLAIGAVLFGCIIFYLSNFIWRIEISTVKNVSPYEIRQALYQAGIIPGTKKKSINVKEIEKIIEDANSNVLWIRARMEGSALKLVIEEKINPPHNTEGSYGNLIADMDGQVDRVYTYSGKAVVSKGSLVKKGDIVIEGIEGSQEEIYQVKPRGVVIANTFYEKKMKAQKSGIVFKRTGRKDSDIYLKIFGKKIYIKKAIKDFVKYDKIEESGILFNKVVYFEKGEVEINYIEEEVVDRCVKELEQSLIKTLTREAQVVDRRVSTEQDGENNLLVNVVFVVQQNIVNENPVEY